MTSFRIQVPFHRDPTPARAQQIVVEQHRRSAMRTPLKTHGA